MLPAAAAWRRCRSAEIRLSIRMSEAKLLVKFASSAEDSGFPLLASARALLVYMPVVAGRAESSTYITHLRLFVARISRLTPSVHTIACARQGRCAQSARHLWIRIHRTSVFW